MSDDSYSVMIISAVVLVFGMGVLITFNATTAYWEGEAIHHGHAHYVLDGSTGVFKWNEGCNQDD